jgi:UDP-3-O-[3-hydroxymyristoyl] N-acetylglucosamine deacetylase
MSQLNQKTAKQASLLAAVSLSGIGVHSGLPATVTLMPAPVDHGIVFFVKMNNGFDIIPADYSKVSTVKNATALGGDRGTSLCTVEHVLAALSGLGIDNCRLEVIGGEIPVLDGSSAPFVEAIRKVGIETQTRDKNFLKILKKVTVNNGESFASIEPYAAGFHIDVEIDFKEEVIGRMRYAENVTPFQFEKDVAPARTFGFLSQQEEMIAKGLAMGASVDNTVIFDGSHVVNAGGLRFSDEMVKHKWLDALGDLSLAGGQIQGKYTSYRGGHKLNVMMLDAIFADASNFEWTNPPLTASNQNNKNISLAVGD